MAGVYVMEYLSETCPIYTRETSTGWESAWQHDEVVWDDYNGAYYSVDTNMEVKRTSERPAQWWAVGVYTAGPAYGGPEEGGWWYDCGELVDHAKIRFFDSFREAHDYVQGLWDYCLTENRDRGDVKLVVSAFTEQMPDTHYPKTRPYYS